jgi:hypothetical protein
MHRDTNAVLTLLLILLAACGGSAPPEVIAPAPTPNEERPITTPATLSGTYFFVTLSHQEADGGSAISETGIFVTDGAGLMDMTIHIRNDNGTVGGPLLRAMRYDVATDGSIGVTRDGNRIWTGGVTNDGRWMIAASIHADRQPEIFIAMRQGGVRGEGFTGNYHMGAYAARAYTPSVASWGQYEFLGGGRLNISNLFENEVGAPTVTGPDASSGGTYTIGGGGEITLGTFPGYTLLGGRSHEGVIIAGGDVTSPIDPLVQVGVPHATGASAALFQGEYWSIATRTLKAALPTPARSLVSFSSVSADGIGALTYETRRTNIEGKIETSSAADVFAVGADGALTLGGGTLRGGITSTGSFAVVAGDLRDGEDPELRVFIRK